VAALPDEFSTGVRHMANASPEQLAASGTPRVGYMLATRFKRLRTPSAASWTTSSMRAPPRDLGAAQPDGPRRFVDGECGAVPANAFSASIAAHVTRQVVYTAGCGLVTLGDYED
jgi:hypothetical protein